MNRIICVIIASLNNKIDRRNRGGGKGRRRGRGGEGGGEGGKEEWEKEEQEIMRSKSTARKLSSSGSGIP